MFVAVAIGTIITLKHKELLAVAHALRIGHSQRRLAHREVIDRVDDICFARSIIANKAIKALVECDIFLHKILKIEN